jgi:hypothetical protein
VYLPLMSKQGAARFCFGATFAIAAFSLGLQFIQDWLGVWDDPILILLFVVSCLFWIGDRWLPGRTPRRVADDDEPTRSSAACTSGGVDADDDMIAEAIRLAEVSLVHNATWCNLRAEDLPAGLGNFARLSSPSPSTGWIGTESPEWSTTCSTPTAPSCTSTPRPTVVRTTRQATSAATRRSQAGRAEGGAESHL